MDEDTLTAARRGQNVQSTNNDMRTAMRINALLVSLAALPLMVGTAHAQDPRARATYGSDSLSAGFTPDPYTVNLTAGGSIQASSVGTGCSGTIAGPPDFELTYTAGSFPLIFRSASSADTTLVINGPDRSWYCDDDSGAEGLNAEVRFNSPQSGVYDVWVGTYSGGMESATLQISELAGGGGAPAPSGGQSVDYSLPATYGSAQLSASFSPDPYSVNVVAGGPVQASTISASCAGSIARAPDFELTYTAGSYPLILRTVSSADTTLVVNGPDRQWYCDDDGGAEGLNAELRWDSPSSGTYDIWVGSLASGTAQARLEISELGGGGGPPVIVPGPTSTLTPDSSLTAAYGEITLRSGFTPDPRRIALRAGGPVPAANASAGCTGSIARAPDYQITYTAGRQPLIVRTESATDTTLVINDPDGVWHCDDDGRGDGNAEVNLDKPSSGVYDIWVGTFSGGTSAATLILTERP